ncbi:Myosin heavy chain-related protein, putative isoform 1 [Quillaja saponaria]|uniref:Myosin heavy chain-related protein, putative isoform 1 n=1 Tax=Quillaja saponaria TaxID=32244 RepID=A0AAD7Q3J9_QUISA|nr:Myosin heavy chain-related protein, putative isoform 1 [Quillaja saponaria]
MFKSWNKKQKLKVVFRLQFQATQVPKLKKSALMISLVPEDVGKPTARLEKSAVQEGTCLWENPVFESVKLIRDTKSGKLNEKLYHFIVSTGSSKSGFLGEASIDFADFAAETQPLTVSLPLKFANSGAILHDLMIKEMWKKMEALRLPNDGSMKNQLSYSNTDDLYNFTDDGNLNQSILENTVQNNIFRASTGSSTTLASYWDAASENKTKDEKTTDQDSSSFQSPLRQNSLPPKGNVDDIITGNHVHRRSNTDWSMGSASDGSLGDWTSNLEDSFPRERLQDPSDNTTEKLRSEIVYLMRQAEVSELELQSLRKQIAKETNRGQNLSSQIISLTEERDELKIKLDQLQSSQKSNNEAETHRNLQSQIKDVRVHLEATKEELNYERELSSDLQSQLKKAQNSNSALILAVRDLELMLEQKNTEILDLSSNITFAEEDLNGDIEIYKEHTEELDKHIKQLILENDLLKQENQDISLKLEHKQTQEIVTRDRYQGSLATIKELELHVERLEEKIKGQADEFSDSLLCIDELEIKVKLLENELEKQAKTFEDDINVIQCAKDQQEQRAIQAEEALRNTRHNNAVMAEGLQEDLRRLSIEMTSKVEENEMKTKKALTEANELRLQRNMLEEIFQKSNEEIRLLEDQNELKLQELLKQLDFKEKTIERISLELDNKSKQLEDAQKYGEEKQKTFLVETQMLRAEIEKLVTEKYDIYKPESTKSIIRSISIEEDDLEKECGSGRKDAETKCEEKSSMPMLKDVKDAKIGALLSEMEILRVQYDELKNSLHREELEKENLKKQIFQLMEELKKKEEVSSTVKKVKNNKGKNAVKHGNLTSRKNEYTTLPCDSIEHTIQKEKLQMPEGTQHERTSMKVSSSEERRTGRANSLHSKMRTTGGMSGQNKVGQAPHESKQVICSEKQLNVFNYQNGGECNDDFLSEVAKLKEINKSMESELKELQERYSDISLKFAEVEGERQQLVMTVRNLKNGKK